jgi:hypothetical protein
MVTDVCHLNQDNPGECVAALSTVGIPLEHDSFVTLSHHGSELQRHLTSPPVSNDEIIPGGKVQKFSRCANTITSTVYTRDYNDLRRFTCDRIAVNLLHAAGESGTLITSEPRPSKSAPNEEHVDPYGLLVSTASIDPVEGPVMNFSIAVSCDQTLKNLEKKRESGIISLKNARPRNVHAQVSD